MKTVILILTTLLIMNVAFAEERTITFQTSDKTVTVAITNLSDLLLRSGLIIGPLLLTKENHILKDDIYTLKYYSKDVIFCDDGFYKLDTVRVETAFAQLTKNLLNEMDLGIKIIAFSHDTYAKNSFTGKSIINSWIVGLPKVCE